MSLPLHVTAGMSLLPKFVVLQRIQWLETRKRAELFAECGLARVWVHSDRVPRMNKIGWTGKQASASMVLCWFVFERGHIGARTFDFLTLPKSRRAACLWPQRN